MATVAELEVIITRLRRNIEVTERLIAQRDQLLANPNLSEAQRQTGETVQARNREVLANQQRELAEAEQALSQAQAPGQQPPPPATAGQAAQDDAAKGPNAPAAAEVNASGRIVPPPDTSTGTNAVPPATSDTGGDTGTDAPVRTTEQTQATGGYGQGINIRAEDGTLSSLRKNPDTGELYDASGLPGGVDLTTEPGTPTRDDAANNSTTTKQTDANAALNALKIQPRPNPLDQYASYTYSISVYLLSANQYERLLRSKSKKIDGYFLLFQDGGAPVNRGGVKQGMGTATAASGSDSGRNPFFPNDYYIDSMTLDTFPLGKATGASHMTATMKLVVNEPNGITLIDNLYSAVANLQQKDGSGKVNYTAADYLAVIRFYGQGADGNPVQASASGGPVIEKFIPFKLASINWSIGSKMVTYEWECVPQGQLIAGYTARGAIPHDMQLTSTTVGKLLGSDIVYSGTDSSTANPGQATTATTQTSIPDQSDAETARLNRQAGNPPSPPKAIAAPTSKKTVTQGLMGALTEFQEELTKPQKGQSESIFNIADRYFIRFVDGIGYDGKVIPASAIENATITLPNTKNDNKLAPAGKNSDTKDLDPLKQARDNMARSYSITAGQMITQAIDLAIRNSSYISGQALVRQNSDGYQEPNPDKRNSPMSWFNIIMNAVPRPGGIDPKRNDHAFDIIYTIKPYRLQNFNSKYFPPSRFAGVHKSYPYWFTGQNTAVTEYQETLNALYNITVSGSDPKNSVAAIQREASTSSLRDIAKFNYAVTSGQSSQGSSDTRLNEVAANAAEYIMSPGDLANAKIKILGDPDWIQQGSLFKEIKPGETQVADVTGFEADGSISFETGDVLFEVVWQRPEDYDLATGVADPYSGGYSGRANKAREPIQSRVYQARHVLSEFRQGAFYQTIEGTLYMFPLPNKKNTVQASGSATTSDALDSQRPAATGGVAGANPANQTAATASRLGTDLQNRVQNDATADPRSLTSTDGGSAAILGAQQASSTQNRYRFPGANAGTPADTLPQDTGVSIRPAAPAAPVTDGTGGVVSTPATAGRAPPVLPPAGGVTPGQVSSALMAQRIADLQSRANGTAPKYQPRQPIATDGG